MANLVTEIERSRYKEGLFGWTSMTDLCIAQTSVTYPHIEPYLRISTLSDGQLEFRYVDTHTKRSSGIEWSMEPMGFIDWRGFWNNYIGSLIYSEDVASVEDQDAAIHASLFGSPGEC